MSRTILPIETDFNLTEFDDGSPLTFDKNTSKKKIEINKLNEYIWGELFDLVLKGKNSACEELLKNGADPNLKGNTGETALYKAVEMDNKELVEIFLKYGANPNKTLEEDITSLHCAVINSNIYITKLLLDYGANPNIQIQYSLQTPLHLAVRVNSNLELIKLLLAFRASASSIDKYDKKPIDYADSNELKLLLSEAETNQLIQISETTNTYHENTIFTLENRLDSFMTKEEEQYFSPLLNTEKAFLENNMKKNEKSQEYINTILSPPKTNEKIDQGVSLSESEEEKEKRMNDSVDGNMSYSRSKEEYISDFPFSSSKRPIEQSDIIYKNLILAKRLNFNNNKISYHKKNAIESISREDNSVPKTFNKENINPNNSSNFSKKNPNNILEKCIHNCSDNYYTTKVNNNNSDNVNYSKSNSKFGNNYNNLYSTNSTQPKSNILNSLKSQKQFQSRNFEEDSYEKISEFSLKSILPKNVPSIQISNIKKWLKVMKLSCYLACFIDNDISDFDRLKHHLKKCDISAKYAFFENIGIKKPGHIFRLITKLALDDRKIDENIVKFILPSKHQALASQNSECNLKVSEEYCCGCSLFKKKNQLDLSLFLQKKNLMHLSPNFIHNGFDLFEYVLLQMFTEYTFTDEILENSLHIYNENDRKMLTRALIEEINKIHIFINSREFTDHSDKYKYEALNLENEPEPKQCLECVIY